MAQQSPQWAGAKAVDALFANEEHRYPTRTHAFKLFARFRRALHVQFLKRDLMMGKKFPGLAAMATTRGTEEPDVRCRPLFHGLGRPFT